LSASLSRAQSDQEQVGLLKAKAYQAAVESVISRYVK